MLCLNWDVVEGDGEPADLKDVNYFGQSRWTALLCLLKQTQKRLKEVVIEELNLFDAGLVLEGVAELREPVFGLILLNG